MYIYYHSLEEKLCSMFCQILPKWGLVNLKFKPEIGFHYFTLAFFIEETDFSINPCIVFFFFPSVVLCKIGSCMFSSKCMEMEKHCLVMALPYGTPKIEWSWVRCFILRQITGVELKK